MAIAVEFVNGRGIILPTGYHPALQSLSRELPGKRMWKNDKLYFENTVANWLAVHGALPHGDAAVWAQGALRRLGEAQGAERERKTLFNRPSLADIPAEARHWCFVRQPYDHQFLAWYISRDMVDFAYFMEMGTGKSKLIVDVAAWQYMSGTIQTLVVVAPNGVNRQWVTKHAPLHMPEEIDWEGLALNTKMSPVSKTAGPRRKFQQFMERTRGRLRVVTINCEALSHASGIALLREVLEKSPCMLAVDESSRFRNPAADRTKALVGLAPMAKTRRIATGTSVVKGLHNLYSQFLLLDKNIIGRSTYTSFKARYCVMGGYEGREIVGYANKSELHERIAPFTFAITKGECLDLPRKVYEEYEFTLSAEQKKILASIKEEALAELGDLEDGGVTKLLEVGNAVHIKVAQIACGFLMHAEENPDGSKGRSEVVWRAKENPRIKALQEVLEDADWPPCVVWCKHREDVAQVAKALRDKGVPTSVYQGGMKPAEQDAACEDFHTGRTRAFVGQVDAGGTGLDGLQVANLTIYYSNSFDPEARMQSEDRTNRIGQAGESSTYVDLLARGSKDRHTLNVLRGDQQFSVNTVEAIRDYLKDLGDEDD